MFRLHNILYRPLCPTPICLVNAIGREFIDYKTSMITDEDPLRGLFFYQDLGFSHYTFLKKGDEGANTPISGLRV